MALKFSCVSESLQNCFPKLLKERIVTAIPEYGQHGSIERILRTLWTTLQNKSGYFGFLEG